MKKLKTIVVEDERLPRLSLLAKLEDYRHVVEVVDSCDNYDDARRSILKNRPDLLFLDIQLCGRDSIQLLDEIKETITLPYIIFTTAYTHRDYLMSAIKLSAIDYLLKPIDKALLEHAIAKVVDRSMAAVQPLTPANLVFKTVNGKLIVSTASIAYAKADGNYAKIVTFEDENLVLESLLSMERRLSHYNFIRVDRSTIVNISMVYRLDQRLQICTLKTENGNIIKLKLSKHGIEQLMEKV
ncbi:MAG: response regulator transcription factor [Muribaculaceae bacterium]|nr:response regulator transcription factor [Muribaculaceae bacterium]